MNAPASSLAGAVNGSEGTAIVGGDLLFKATLFGLGVALDKTVSGSVQPWAGSMMAGLVFNVLPSLRLEALGEVAAEEGTSATCSARRAQTFLGVRPGISFRLLPSPIRFGVSALLRWPSSGGDIGSPDYRFVGRVGIELP